MVCTVSPCRKSQAANPVLFWGGSFQKLVLKPLPHPSRLPKLLCPTPGHSQLLLWQQGLGVWSCDFTYWSCDIAHQTYNIYSEAGDMTIHYTKVLWHTYIYVCKTGCMGIKKYTFSYTSDSTIVIKFMCEYSSWLWQHLCYNRGYRYMYTPIIMIMWLKW